jgi:hypothetical protein
MSTAIILLACVGAVCVAVGIGWILGGLFVRGKE